MQPISVVQIAALEGEAATSWREPTLFQAEAFYRRGQARRRAGPATLESCGRQQMKSDRRRGARRSVVTWVRDLRKPVEHHGWLGDMMLDLFRAVVGGV